MPLFRYRALLANGKKNTGVIEADSLVSAKDRLRFENMIITEIFPYLAHTKKKSIPASTLLDITRMICQLLQAGIPIYETILIVEEKYRKFSFHSILVDLCDRVKKGATLSSALSHYDPIFDRIYISMVKAGEESGSLIQSFEQLTDLLKDKNRLKKQLIGATAYPLFLITFCGVVFIALLLGVIPSLKNLFEGRSLHPLTQFVFNLSDLFVHHSLFIFGGTTLCILLFVITLSHRRLRPTWNLIVLKLPLIGPLVLQAATVRFCRTCSLLLKGGTPLLSSLQLSRAVFKNLILEKSFEKIEQNVSEGSTLSEEIEKIHLLPSLVSRMLAIGEKTGQIAIMLTHIATLCEEELSRNLQRYTSLLQPLLLLILGLLIGTVVLSILIPLTDVGSFL